MASVLILSHGPLAQELLTAASTINGEVADDVAALCLDWDDEPEEAMGKTRQACEGLGGNGGVLILTDMFGGTPHNIARRLAEPGRVEVVTGVNLPMVLRLCCRSRDERSLGDLTDWITDKGKTSICRTACEECD